MFRDLPSEIIHALLPLFLTATLGVSVAMVGLIDGIAESTASISKVFSGYLSDRLGRRKPLILLGYGVGALSKPFFALAGSASMVLGARFADRIGKAIRGAPRDALVADLTPIAIRGRAFGLRQSLDTIGAFLGPLLAIGLMLLFANDMGSVFWVAAIPAVVPVLLIVFAVKDREARATAAQAPVQIRDISRFHGGFWSIVIVGVVFTLARFSAYDFVTERGALFLGQYARSADPFAKVGERTVSVQVTSVVRASDRSFQVKWTESEYERGSLAGTSRWTAILSVVVKPPSSAETLRRNPLGLHVDAIDWSRELDVPAPAGPPPEAAAPPEPSLPLGSPLDPALGAEPAPSTPSERTSR